MPEPRIEQGPRMSPLEKKILDNFYTSFKFSQGDLSIHFGLMIGIARELDAGQLRREFPHPSDINQKLKKRAARVRPPKNHAGTDNESTQSLEAWRRNMQILQATHYPEVPAAGELKGGDSNDDYVNPEIPETVNSELDEYLNELLQMGEREMLITVLDGLIMRDDAYMLSGRPNREEGSPEKYKSFTKSYIIDGTSTKSEELDALFVKLRHKIIEIQRKKFSLGRIEDLLDDRERGIKNKLSHLRESWEARNPGQQFFPEGFADES